MNNLYKVTVTQYYDFLVEAPDRKTADHIARENVTWEDHFTECCVRTTAARPEYFKDEKPAATWEGEL